ncbi:hypothetical protein FB45DRAFT_1035456 [Roridomyces roridus]|uniref:Uncharacterized protein n=1 Tax=Roridomyces roridus TaxID=1738132 RepID=A0AAD7BAA3_9AGAR|nr:hypothetical protein FB45DRAFT_1035456 [Roridomyces roridus]
MSRRQVASSFPPPSATNAASSLVRSIVSLALNLTPSRSYLVLVHSQYLTPSDIGAATNSLRFVPRRPAPGEPFFFNIAFMYLVFRDRRLVRLTPKEGVSSGRNPDSFDILQPLAAAGPPAGFAKGQVKERTATEVPI